MKNKRNRKAAWILSFPATTAARETLTALRDLLPADEYGRRPPLWAAANVAIMLELDRRRKAAIMAEAESTK